MTDLQVCPLLSLSLDGRKSGQASSEDLLPLGYGERERLGEDEPRTGFETQGKANNVLNAHKVFYFASGRYIIDSMDDNTPDSDDTLVPIEGEPEHKLQPAFPCPKCGAQIPVGQQFCSTCGERFEYRCGHCGAVAETLSGFCTNCGRKLYQQTQLAKPSAKKVRRTRQEEKPKRKKAIPQPIGQVSRYLILITIIIFIGAILYIIGTSPQGEMSNWLGGGFSFGGQSPPSTPPSTDAQPTPKPAPDLPRYTTDQVIAASKNLSPDCRAPAKRTG